ncbi:MAG: hypothetical protein RIT07_709 [Bacteroidota bacterium]|jgi:uncharacterized protein (TIGR01777 family)
MNILVTGGTGMLGKKLISMLKENGMDVMNLTTSLIKQNVKQKVFFWDIKRGIFPKNLTQPIDAVIHLAGANVGTHRWNERYKKEILESRTETSRFLLQKLKEQNNLPKTYITASGTDYYANPSSIVWRESDGAGHHFLAHVCRAWESVAEEWEKAGCITQVVRTPVILEKNEGFIKKMLMTAKLRVIPTTGHPNNMLSWVHILDLCRIYLYLMKQTEPGIWNAVAPEPSSMRQLVEKIDLERGISTLHPNVPCFFLKAMLGEMGSLACVDQKVSAEKLLGTGFRYHYPTLQSALHDIFTK